jgi:spore maturation protein CgeB
MKIGLYIKWNKYSLNSKVNVIGEELFGESLCRALKKLPEVSDAQLYAPNYMPDDLLDVMIYLNDIEINNRWAKKNIIYFLNDYGPENENILRKFQKIGYDGYIFFSKQLLEAHCSLGYKGIFLPFGVDLDLFYPREKEDKYNFEVTYVGNDIKGEDRTMRYLYPATKYNFGLFGNWKIPQARFHFWRNFKQLPPYKKKFEKLSKGKIPQEKLPILYSSAKINLNCTLQSFVVWKVINLRIYEILACKGFLISDRVASAEKELEGGLVFTEGGNDLIEKIDYFLKNKEERESIAQRGYEYIITHASIEARAKELYKYVRSLK